MTTCDTARSENEMARLEDEMIRRAEAGDELDGGTGPFDRDTMKNWSAERTIRASALRRLLVGKNPRVHAKGVQLHGIKIIGQLDLESATLRCPLHLKNCYLDEKHLVNLDYAEVSLLTLNRCYLGGLTGNTLTVTKGMDLTRSVFSGQLILLDADIKGHLICTGARVTSVNSDRKPPAVPQPNASADYWAYALVADGLKVGADAVMDKGFTATGGVWLNRAVIAGELNCTKAKLTAAKGKGYALYADGLKVGANVFLDGLIARAGGVRLSAADIGGELLCHGTQLNGADKGGNALRANEMKVGSNVFLIEEFATDGGKVSLRQAFVGGDLRLEPRTLAEDKDKVAFDATGTQVAQKLVWKPKEQICGKVILEQVAVGRLEDSWTKQDGERPNGYWPTGGMLRLDGLTYGGISPIDDDEVNKRLCWIRSQYQAQETSPAIGSLPDKTPDRNSPAGENGPASFATQPYQQLANVYLQAGRDEDARVVAIARRRDLRSFGKITRPGKFGNRLLDITIGYGYRTWRAAFALALLYALVVLFFWFARYYHAVIPLQMTPGLETVPTAANCSAHDYPCFNPFGYAIDTVIPLINVHQADFWGPNAKAGAWGHLSVVITYLGTIFGWLFATLAVAGYTGLARTTAAP